MDILRISVAVLAVWRITHLLQTEDGPFEILARSRSWLRRASLTGLADCFYCLSLWLAAPVALYLGSFWLDRLILWPALSGAAIFLNRFAESIPLPASYYEEPIREEKSQCFVAEMPENTQPGILRLTPAPSEYTILSSGQLYSGTRAQRG
jgi:hypothetical protein